MKKHLLAAILTLALCSCSPSPAPASSSPEVSSEPSTSSEESSSQASSSKHVSQDGVYDFYCVNDYHGSIVEQYNGRNYEAGIAKYFGKLKALKQADPEHVVLLSAGDMFQGSLESNDNLGALVIEAMNEAGFDAMTLGNHEFDYGQEALLTNIANADFPVLGGNIKKYDGRETSEPWNPAVQSSVILERGGNRIGVVGMIGYGQTTSITSKYVQDVTFVSPNRLAINEAITLRGDEKCDLLVYSYHDDVSTCYTAGLEKPGLFNGVFCGHKHVVNNELIDGVPFIQSKCNGQAISHFQITIKDGQTACTDYGVIDCDPSWEEDPEIAAIRDKYIGTPAFIEKATAEAGRIEGTLYSSEGVANVACKAMYDKFKPLHPDLVAGIENGQRANLSGTVTYHDIYKATPFMNKIVIAKVKGSEVIREAESACCYHADNQITSSSATYTIACIDYVLYHQNEQKRYNYFPSLNEDFESKIIAEYEVYPADLTFDFIKYDNDGFIRASDFRNSSPGFGTI